MSGIKKVLLATGILFLFSACGGSGVGGAASGDSAVLAVSESAYSAVEAANYTAPDVRKYIITASLTLRLKDLKKCEFVLHEIMEKYNAYTTETSIRKNVLYYTIKIPANNHAPCFAELKTIGKIEYYKEGREDVTLNYYDIEGRLATQRELMKKYQQYIERAVSIEEIMAVEKLIAELQHEIDRTGGEFTKLNNTIDFSTVTLVLKGPRDDDLYYIETIGDKIEALFNHYDDYISAIISILIGLIIYGIPSLILLSFLYLVLFGQIGILKKVWRLLNGSGGKGK
jgi:hypothetical protein